MDQALVFASIVLGVAVAFELNNLNHLLRAKNVKWHWAQPLFALFVLLTIMSFWWMLASNQIEGEITLAQFVPIMWVLVVLNLLAAASLPDDIPDAGVDLAEYYLENKRYLWGLYLLILVPLGANWIVVGVRRSRDFTDVLPYLGSELPPMLVVLMLFFVKRWSLVALGFAALSLVVVAWLTRAI